MSKRKVREPKEENVTLGPATREGEHVFGVAHIFASFNDTFIHVTDLSGRETMVRITDGNSGHAIKFTLFRSLKLIKSRNSTFKPALQLLSSIDMIYSGTVEDAADENGSMGPLIYEDYDDSDEDDGSEEVMETDEEDKAEVEALSDVSDFEGVMA